jgi:hypothetical protein
MPLISPTVVPQYNQSFCGTPLYVSIMNSIFLRYYVKIACSKVLVSQVDIIDT